MDISYSKHELAAALDEISNFSHDGVRGVRCFKGTYSGPTVGVTMLTHGCEPAGLAAYRYFVKEGLWRHLMYGEVRFVVNNIDAAKQYFLATTREEEDKARFVELNMNRLPEDSRMWAADTRLEVRRAVELLPIWRSFDYGVDIHSTQQDTDPMLVLGDHVDHRLFRGMPISIVLENIHNVQIGRPAYFFYGGEDKKISAFEIEAGQDTGSESYRRAIYCLVKILNNLNMLKYQCPFSMKTANGRQVYTITGSIIPPDDSYSLTRVFTDFEAVGAGTVLATGNGKSITMPRHGHVIFCPPDTRIRYCNEEVFFVSKPVVIR